VRVGLLKRLVGRVTRYQERAIVRRYLREPGIEIGAFKSPIPGIQPILIDRFAEYAHEPTRADYYGDACDLPFFDCSLQYVASSHLLEHVANPLAALAEWYRVLTHGGAIYMVVPDRRKTFDYRRPLTSPEHMLEDYRQQVTQSDGTHIDDFVYGVDWRQFSPPTPDHEEQTARDQLAEGYRRAVDAGQEINIHFHVFESGVLTELLRLGNRHRVWPGRIEAVDLLEGYPRWNPNGFLVVARVHKPSASRTSAGNARTGLRPDARRF
jgi:SAM-dependent methyltransferase